MNDTLGYLIISLVVISLFYGAFHDPQALEVVKINNFFRRKIKISELNHPKFKKLLDALLELRRQGCFDNLGSLNMRSAFDFRDEVYVYPYLQHVDIWHNNGGVDSFALDDDQMQEVFAIILGAEDPETLPKFEG